MRQPQNMGHGIHMHDQPFLTPDKLVKGDTFSDADYGPCVWDGKKWVQQCTRKDVNWERKRTGWDVVTCVIDNKLEKKFFQGYTRKEAINKFINEFKIYFHG